MTMWKRSSYPSKALCLLLCLILLISAGCTKEDAKPDIQDCVTFTDALGREVSIPENPRRVAALIGSFAEVWQLAGGSLCASSEDAWDDFALEMGDAVNIGGAHSPDLELLIASAPDLVIASASTASNVDMLDTLEGLGIYVAYFDVDSFDDYLAMLDICTDITGRKDLYEENGTAIKAKIDSLKAGFSLPEEEKKVLLLRASSGSVKAKGSEGTVLGEMLYDLGCVNIADSEKSLLEELSIESIMQNEPYRIFVVTMGDDTEKAIGNLAKMIEDDPAWASLTAVKENRLHIMDRKLFNIKPNANWAVSYEKLTDILQSK